MGVLTRRSFLCCSMQKSKVFHRPMAFWGNRLDEKCSSTNANPKAGVGSSYISFCLFSLPLFFFSIKKKSPVYFLCLSVWVHGDLRQWDKPNDFTLEPGRRRKTKRKKQRNIFWQGHYVVELLAFCFLEKVKLPNGVFLFGTITKEKEEKNKNAAFS